MEGEIFNFKWLARPMFLFSFGCLETFCSAKFALGRIMIVENIWQIINT